MERDACSHANICIVLTYNYEDVKNDSVETDYDMMQKQNSEM